jgi:epoxyqueuosine reductase
MSGNATVTGSLSGTELKERVIAFARRVGFDSCRVAECAPPAHAGEFDAWLRQEAHGEMDYMRRGAEKRRDPQKILPGAQSIVVLALNYFQDGESRSSQALGRSNNFRREGRTAATGRIARYAWGTDYHDVIGEKLKEIDRFLRGFGGVQKYYVDTGPVLERDHAAAAGIGWHGKSTMLIDERLGTWFFLAEIFTTLQLPPDGPARDRCGKCDRCIKACPTGAITEPHRLDARRCISYLTIELKGAIPTELRPLIGDRIFGCDDCLEACPWNRFAQVSHEAAFRRREPGVERPLRDYLRLTDAEFRDLFRHSPIKRIKRRRLLRNVCVALGNVGSREDLPALEQAACEADPLIAEHARWAVERIRRRHSSRSHAKS